MPLEFFFSYFIFDYARFRASNTFKSMNFNFLDLKLRVSSFIKPLNQPKGVYKKPFKRFDKRVLWNPKKGQDFQLINLRLFSFLHKVKTRFEQPLFLHASLPELFVEDSFFFFKPYKDPSTLK